MEFEFDPAKSETNRIKHGIDFIAAQGLWNDGQALEVESDYLLERRLALTAVWKGRLWTAIYTVRGGRVRIISVRRARKDEELLYEQKKR
jgi:uncharacterized protein